MAVSAAVAGGEIPGPEAGRGGGEARNHESDNTVRRSSASGILTHVEPILKAAATEGHVKIVAARYDLSTGLVQVLK